MWSARAETAIHHLDPVLSIGCLSARWDDATKRATRARKQRCRPGAPLAQRVLVYRPWDELQANRPALLELTARQPVNVLRSNP